MELLWQRLDTWLRLAMPAITAILMTLLSVVVWPLPYVGSVMPPLALVALYYWSSHRPELFPVSVAFLLGLLNDILNDLPLGVSAFLFTMARQIIWRQRRFFAGHSFMMLWMGFTVVAFFMMVLQWSLVGLVRWQATPVVPVIVQTLLVILLFPLPCAILIRIQRSLLSNV